MLTFVSRITGDVLLSSLYAKLYSIENNNQRTKSQSEDKVADLREY